MAIKNPALYAVVPRPRPATGAPVPKKQSRADVQNQRSEEHRLKLDIDRGEAILKRLEERAARYAKEAARWQKKKALACARIERMEDAILGKMAKANLRRADGFHVVWEARPCPPSVQVDDLRQIPEEYMVPKPSEPDKLAIKRDLQQGFVVENVDKVPAAFRRGRAPILIAIKAAIDEGTNVPGVRAVASIPGVRLTQAVSLQRK